MSLPRALPRILTSFLLVAPAAAQVQPPTGGPAGFEPKPSVEGVEVTFLANAGFLLHSGKYSVLIDAFLKEPYYIYEAVPPQVHQDMVLAKPPFDGIVLALVSHNHGDHFQPRTAEKFLKNNNQAQLVTLPDVLATLKANAKDFDSIKRRVTPVQPRPTQTLAQDEMSVEFMTLVHTGPENKDVQNLGHLIEMGGMKILHVGDAKPTLDTFAAYNLPSKKIDIAIVPYWYFGEGARQVLTEQIRARTLIACHIPAQELEKFRESMKTSFPDLIIFNSLESRTFQPEHAAKQETGG